MKKLFLDTEFTGLVSNTTLISIGIISECGKKFYAEFTDYNVDLCDDWINENVIKNLKLRKDSLGILYTNKGEKIVRGDSIAIKYYLRQWFNDFQNVQIVSDCLAYDWVLFCNLFGGAFSIPKNINYIPIDLSTLLYAKGIDPDINREKFGCGEVYSEMKKHNALWDAEVIEMCYNKLMNVNFKG